MSAFFIESLSKTNNPDGSIPIIEPDAAYTAAVVITGFTVVFAVLILLILLMQLMGVLSRKPKPEPVTETIIPITPKETVKEIDRKVVRSNKQKDEEIVAAITGALTIIYEETDVNFEIKSITPVTKNVSGGNQWAMAGIFDNTNPF